MRSASIPRFIRFSLGRVPLLVALCLGALAGSASFASAAQPGAVSAPGTQDGAITPAVAEATCSGTPESPGVLTGDYPSNVSVEGECVVNAGRAIVRGTLTIHEGASLIAAFALNDRKGSGKSKLVVRGDVNVKSGGSLVMGCDPAHFACFDSSEQASSSQIFGNLNEQQPLGVVIHKSTIKGNITENGGGGGLNCEPAPPFAPSPVYSDYEDVRVRGHIEITGMTSCWLGIARAIVSGEVRLVNNQFADPDAIEILSNQIFGNLVCKENSNVWDSTEASPEHLYPRIPKPNKVTGKRAGQCVLASPETEGGAPGPGPF